ncbi:DUF3592 domain-containing protein [Parafrankia irregularis]|uniref:DUF3592 domain-containing protein n=1 Tax=Parafrankia irregularis TaxID=795642 RepID=UPI001F616ABF|nr:DUF3592 domain-containing protein [Parafrankia irregularis]
MTGWHTPAVGIRLPGLGAGRRRPEPVPFRLGVDVVWKAFAAGVVLLALAAYWFHWNVTYAEDGTAVTAEVLDAGGPKERPTVRFVTRNGVPTVTQLTDYGDYPSVGEIITVEYDERDPGRARRYEGSWYWAYPAGVTVIGLAVPVTAVWIFCRRRREFPGWEPLAMADVTEIFSSLSAPWWAGPRSAGSSEGSVKQKRNDSRDCQKAHALMLRRDQQEIHRALPGWDLWGVGAGPSVERWRAGQRLSMAYDEVWCRRRRGETWRLKISLVESAPPTEATGRQ